jgi:FtsZ-binding cell division protein ZapB|tara:strand:- start:657 stop:920 length:264 start_codon:yes stop_codon:yes gene_type:complete
MEVIRYAYPEEVITKINEENKFLKSEKKEEKKKFDNTIRVLRLEIEKLKEKERLLEIKLNEAKSNNQSLTAQLDLERKKIDKFHITI